MGKNRKNAKSNSLGEKSVGIAIGMIIGISIGVAQDNIALGVGLGIAFGTAFSLLKFDSAPKNKK